MNIFRQCSAFFSILVALLCSSCVERRGGDVPDDLAEPSFLNISERPEGGWTVVSVSPFDGSADSLTIDEPLRNIIVMSSSHYGFLDAIGRVDVISGVSGSEYLWLDSDSKSSEASPEDVGYDTVPDYEKIVSLAPQLVLTYAVSGVESPFVGRLKQLGIKVLTINEHLERHPLARAAYIRLFGALTGEMAAADSVLDAVSASYRAVADSVAKLGEPTRKVLLNIPYNDQWFVPSTENYLSAMISDAGGMILGGESGKAASSVMSVETAYSLGKDADCWLNVGWCATLGQLEGVNPIFPDMIKTISANATDRGFGGTAVVWNDNKRVNAKGGNDIWQSGAVRPDLVLRDLVSILHPGGETGSPVYYRPLQ